MCVSLGTGAWPLTNNSVFGKTMENLRKRVDIKVVRTNGSPKEKEQIRKIIAKPNYDRAVIFSEELSALHSHKTRLKLNQSMLGCVSWTYSSI